MTIPTNHDFATEVKYDRLRLLWRVTFGLALLFAWVLLNVTMLQKIDVSRLVPPVVVLLLGALAARSLLGRGGYRAAAWTFVLADVAALGLALADPNASLRAILPFAFPVVMFIAGLLLTPGSTLMTAVLASAIIIVVPSMADGTVLALSGVQIAAVILTLIGAVVSAQVASDMYHIADWALENYQRERRVAGELFESQQALERSLARSTALSTRLQDTNMQLISARASAEEAKHFRGQFLANMSHELRTPLNAIIGFSETMLKFPMMYDGIRLPDAYEDDMNQIYSSGRLLLTLINDILDLAKVDAGKLDVRMGRVDLQLLFQVVISMASGLVGNKPLTLETDIPEYLPPVWADEARVRQVLLNLYSNAAKFTDTGSIKLAAAEIEGGVRISVSDSGIGISRDNLEIIFEEFKQAETGGRDPRSGAGLGLAISRQLLTLMGGRIWAESEPGKGSTFYVVLQGYTEAAALPEPEMVKSP